MVIDAVRILLGSLFSLYLILPPDDQAEETSDLSFVCLRRSELRRVKSSVILKLFSVLLMKNVFLWRITASLTSLDLNLTIIGGVLSSRDGRVWDISIVSRSEGMQGRDFFSSASLRMG